MTAKNSDIRRRVDEKLIAASYALDAAEHRFARAVVAEAENHRRGNSESADERRRAWRESDAIVAELEAAEADLARARSEFARAGIAFALLSELKPSPETRR